MDMNCTFVIPFHNNISRLCACLNSIKQHAPDGIPIIIVANNQDESHLEVEDIIPEGLNTRIEKFTYNMGYPAAVNRGISIADTTLIAVLDDDTQICSGWLEAHVETHRNEPNSAISGSCLLDPETGRVWSTVISIAGFTLSHPYRDRPSVHPPLSGYKQVQCVCSAAMMVRKSAWEELNGLDEKLSLFFSDPDLCVRANNIGRKNFSVFNAKAYHGGDGSSWNRRSSREDQKAYYFDKHKGNQTSDVGDYIEEQLSRFLETRFLQQRYTLIDISTVIDPDEYTDHITKHAEVINSYKFPQLPRDQENVSLFDLIGYSLGTIESPIIYLCDRYYSLKNNLIWRMLREGKNDLVIDRHTNIIELDSIQLGGE